MTIQNDKHAVSPDPTVAPGTGPPTLAELYDHYPAKFTWEQLKTFINSGFEDIT